MNSSEKKQGASFSYIDIFFLLFAGLVLSVGIGFLVEVHRENRVETYRIRVSATVEEALQHAVPEAGDVLFDAEGEACGKVLSVETEATANELILKMRCRWEGEKPTVGEQITVETPGSIRLMQVDSVKSDGAEKGR